MSGLVSDFATVLAGYSDDCQPGTVFSAVPGGFSGSRIWRLETARGQLCLRRWPAESVDATRLRYIHETLAGVRVAGFQLVPLPIATLAGETFVKQQDHLWELAPWLAGEGDQPNQLNRSTSPGRVQGALAALANFHQAASRIGLHKAAAPPGLVDRTELLKVLLSGGMQKISQQVKEQRNLWPELADRATPLLTSFWRAAEGINRTVSGVETCRVPIQPCIRDVHRDHLLFVNDSVTGIVDFGSMRPDCVAGDIARLLGSMALDDRSLWRRGLAAYESIRPLTEVERDLVAVYDQTAVLLSGINWLRWVFVEGRQFDNREAVLQRFDVILGRLANLAAGG